METDINRRTQRLIPDQELARLEKKRISMHAYIIMKLEEHDYHGVADAAMDLRELDARANAIKDYLEMR